jgi:hypothetical protein
MNAENRIKEKKHRHSKFTWPSFLLNGVFGLAAVILLGFLSYQTRLNVMALMLSLCGGCYLNGPYGKIETLGGIFFYFCALFGLNDPLWLAVGWFCHAIVDVFHHYSDYPIVHWIWWSSTGCAAMDPILAIYMLLGAPSLLP